MAREISGPVPGPNSTELSKRRDEAVPRGVFNTVPIFVAAGEGATVSDVDGNRFIDLAGGLGVLNVGRANPRVVNAVHEQVDKFLHECFHVSMYEGYVELAEMLNRLTPGDHPKKTMLANSGAEAVENAVKISRYATERDAVVSFTNAFHGRTLMGMTLTAKEMPYKHGFGPFAPETYRVPFPYCYRCPFDLTHPSCGMACIDYTADVIDSQIGADNVACVVVEPVQGEGGFVVAPDDWLPALRSVCTERDILMVDDEVQTGMGRTGRLFAIEHYGVVPDLVTTAKSLGAGFPISGVTGRAETMEAPHVGGLGGTYGGNPVACAAALAVLAELTETDLMARAEEQGRIIRGRLDALEPRLQIVGEVRGLGPMVGIELVVDKESKEPNKAATSAVAKRCHERGVLILKAGTYDNVVRLLAPLVISDDDLHEGLDVLIEALEWADGGMR
jgi:4-aminobutyrate aminotransferase / (S)-3-amino-2-methylpropionate transaminase / 5-aminovalerate transaminase